MIIQSKQYLEFEKMCKPYMQKYSVLKISEPINLKCTFYVKDQRRRDVCNFVNAIQDILVKYSVIEDDNYKIIKSIDGTRIVYRPKAEPETIIEITEYKE